MCLLPGQRLVDLKKKEEEEKKKHRLTALYWQSKHAICSTTVPEQQQFDATNTTCKTRNCLESLCDMFVSDERLSRAFRKFFQ